MLRNESNIILAANQAIDICNLITSYLTKLQETVRQLKYKGYKNPIKLEWPFTVTIMEVRESELLVGLSGTKTVSYQITNYYEPDDEAFTEGYGMSNISGYSSCSKEVKVDQVLRIPFRCLLRTYEEMTKDTREIVTKWIEDDKAEAKANEIAKLEKQLAAVRAS